MYKHIKFVSAVRTAISLNLPILCKHSRVFDLACMCNANLPNRLLFLYSHHLIRKLISPPSLPCSTHIYIHIIYGAFVTFPFQGVLLLLKLMLIVENCVKCINTARIRFVYRCMSKAVKYEM